MKGYRAFFMDIHDHIKSREEFMAESDEEALRVALKIFAAHTEAAAFELWQEKQRILRKERAPLPPSVPLPLSSSVHR